MIRSTLSCLRRVRFGSARWSEDVEKLNTVWRNVKANAVAAPLAALAENQAPGKAELDAIANRALDARKAGVPQNIYRNTTTVLSDATAREVNAMRSAVLRMNYFPALEAPSERDAEPAHGLRGYLQSLFSTKAGSSRPRKSVLQVPSYGTWTDRSQSITTKSGTASVPAEMEVGDLLLLSVQMTPGLPLLEHISIVCVDQVVHKFDEDGAAGFTVATTAEHDEIGTHTAVLRWTQVSDSVDAANAAKGETSGVVGETDPVRDTVRFLREASGLIENEEPENEPRYKVTLDIAVGTAFQPHLAMNPLAVAFGAALAQRACRQAPVYLRAVAEDGCAVAKDPRTQPRLVVEDEEDVSTGRGKEAALA
eukprot:INCI15197.1.p1 GENE.INCI15197.1~~INCI15197.1.p1  ORF type:complete len:366 (-),score=70.59 INCI15197.1:139-1236(-)